MTHCAHPHPCTPEVVKEFNNGTQRVHCGPCHCGLEVTQELAIQSDERESA